MTGSCFFQPGEIKYCTSCLVLLTLSRLAGLASRPVCVPAFINSQTAAPSLCMPLQIIRKCLSVRHADSIRAPVAIRATIITDPGHYCPALFILQRTRFCLKILAVSCALSAVPRIVLFFPGMCIVTERSALYAHAEHGSPLQPPSATSGISLWSFCGLYLP